MKSFAAAAITTIGTSLAVAAIIAFLPASAVGAEPEATKPARVLEIMKPVFSETGTAVVALTEVEMDGIRGTGAELATADGSYTSYTEASSPPRLPALKNLKDAVN